MTIFFRNFICLSVCMFVPTSCKKYCAKLNAVFTVVFLKVYIKTGVCTILIRNINVDYFTGSPTFEIYAFEIADKNLIYYKNMTKTFIIKKVIN